MKELKEGFYYLKSVNEPEPILVHGYKCTDYGDAFVFGFNTHDGGGVLPLKDLIAETEVIPVKISKAQLIDIEKVTTGWDGYAWKDGEYIDDIQEYFDSKLKGTDT